MYYPQNSVINLIESNKLLSNTPSSLGHILLIEDNPIAQQAVAALAQKLGYRVTLATTGNEVLKQSLLGIDLILLDLHR